MNAINDKLAFPEISSNKDKFVRYNIILNKVKNKIPNKYILKIYRTENGILVRNFFIPLYYTVSAGFKKHRNNKSKLTIPSSNIFQR